MPEQRLAGLSTRVTGSDRGIGQAMARALGQEEANCSGYDCHANDGACEPVAAVLNEGVQAMAMQTDFSRGRDIASFVEHSVE
jgi:NAD(P)-dependent dehydrogenase (short-subunit alcohol dehydrogenase family)